MSLFIIATAILQENFLHNMECGNFYTYNYHNIQLDIFFILYL